MKTTLPTDSEARKAIPLVGGVLRYFPAALAGVAKHSKAGNDKHNPGEELHHARGKSNDHAECILRHLMDLQDLQAHISRTAEKRQSEIDAVLAEANALAWRALALSQELHERFGAPLAPGAKLPELHTTFHFSQGEPFGAKQPGAKQDAFRPTPREREPQSELLLPLSVIGRSASTEYTGVDYP